MKTSLTTNEQQGGNIKTLGSLPLTDRTGGTGRLQCGGFLLAPRLTAGGGQEGGVRLGFNIRGLVLSTTGAIVACAFSFS